MLARAKIFGFACIDPRFLRALETFIEKEYNLKPTEYDIKTDAGGVNELCKPGPISEWMIRNAMLAYQKHGTRMFLLCNHMGCSYYQHTHAPENEAQEKKIHEGDIRIAAKMLRDHMSDIKVVGFVVSLQEKTRKYLFKEITLAP